MLRDDAIAKMRKIAKIDANEDGSYLDEEAILNAIKELADENDRLEAALAASIKTNADMFFNESDVEVLTEDPEEPDGDETPKLEDFINY